MDEQPDELYQAMNEWEMRTAVTAMGNGVEPAAARALASSMRWELETGLRKPGPLIVITGI